MGYEHKIYIGPYARCQNRTESSAVIHRYCARCNEARSNSASFCQVCGSHLVERETGQRTAKSINAIEIADVIGQRLYVFGWKILDGFDGFDAFVPNVAWDGQSTRGPIDDSFSGEAWIRDSDLPTERVRFEMAFKVEIAHLRKVYGETSVEIRWGVLGGWA